MGEVSEKPKIKTCRDLIVYQLAYRLAMEIFETTKKFPIEERYALTDQVRRASRSIPANIAEGWAKRHYENVFIRHLVDASGSCEETKTWLDFARDVRAYPNINFSIRHCEPRFVGRGNRALQNRLLRRLRGSQ